MDCAFPRAAYLSKISLFYVDFCFCWFCEHVCSIVIRRRGLVLTTAAFVRADFVAVRRGAEIMGDGQQHGETGRIYGEDPVGMLVSTMEEEATDVKFQRYGFFFFLLKTAAGGNFRVPPVFFDWRRAESGDDPSLQAHSKNLMGHSPVSFYFIYFIFSSFHCYINERVILLVSSPWPSGWDIFCSSPGLWFDP